MILIVDDKYENIFSLKSLLELHSFAVDTASSGEEALKKILKNEYALIILDVQMPGMDGFEVAEAITGYSKTKDIPIIFLTALSTEKKFITKGYSSGGVDYVTKPYDTDLLLLKVKIFCRLYEQTKELNRTQKELRKEIEFRTKAEEDLMIINQSLEEKIEERTEDLRRSNDLLEKKNRELQQFAYISSHDLKEPLRKIQVFSNLARDRYFNEKADIIPYLDKILVSSKRMHTLINDVLTYSMLESEPVFLPTDLNAVLDGVISDLDIRIRETNAIISFNNLPSLEVVPVQMQQLFNNLISNAIKFSVPGQVPEVSIMADIINEPVADAQVNENGLYCRIAIKDNGIGFNEAYLDKIFAIFQRLHTFNEYEGTGIGLAIVKKIVDTHNGSITAISKENNGSTFFIILPMKRPKNKHNQLS